MKNVIGACFILFLCTSCGLIDGDLFRPLQKTDLDSSEPTPTPSPSASPSPGPGFTGSGTPMATDSWGLNWTTNDLLAVGTAHVIAGGSRGLVTYDVSSPYAPTPVTYIKHKEVRNISRVSSTAAFVSYTDGTLELIDVTDPEAPGLIDGVTLTAPKRAVVQGTMAFVPDGTSGIRVIDFSDPTNMQVTTTVDTDGEANSLLLDGTHLYLADGSGGVKIYSVLVPTTPTLLATVTTAVLSDDAISVAVKGNYLYVAVDYSGVDIIDITDKSNPLWLSNYADPDRYYEHFLHLEVQGNTLLGAHYEKGFIALDITTPTSIQYLASAMTFLPYLAGAGKNFSASSTHAYVASAYFGIAAVDISNVRAPHVPYSFTSGRTWWTRSVDASTTTAYICENIYDRIAAIDLSTLSHPTYLGESADGTCAHEIVQDGGIVYAAADSVMKVVDFTNPASPTEIASITPASGSSARNIAKQGNYVYLTNSARLSVYDVTTPSSPTLRGFYTGAFADVIVDGSYAYLNNSETLTILDITPATPTLVRNFALTAPGGSAFRKITKSGNYIYMVGPKYWAIVNVTDPANPTQVYINRATDTAGDIAVVGTKAYLCQYYTGVIEYDISDLNSVKRVGSFPAQCMGMMARNGNLYYVDESLGMKILNTTSRPYINLANKTTRLTTFLDFGISGNLAIMADYLAGALLVDLTDPENPTIISRISLDQNRREFKVHGNILYAVDLHGIFSFDISTPAAPINISHMYKIGANNISGMETNATHLYTIQGSTLGVYSLATPGSPTQVTTVASASMVSLKSHNANLLAASGSAGLRVFSTATPGSPTVLGTVNTPGSATSVVADGDYAYVADATGGLQVIRISTRTIDATLATAASARYITKKDDYLFIGLSNGNIAVIDVTSPTSPVLKSTLTVPSSSATENQVAVAGNYLYALNSYAFEVFDITDINNIHQ